MPVFVIILLCLITHTHFFFLCVSQSTHNDIELFPLYRILVGLSVYLATQSFQTLYPLTNTGNVYLSTHKAVNLYPLNRTLVGLSMYLSTHKAITLYPLYRKLVGLSVYLFTHKAINFCPLY